MFDHLDADDAGEHDDDRAFWNELLDGWVQAVPPAGRRFGWWAGSETDDLSERLRRHGGRLPGSDPRL